MRITPEQLVFDAHAGLSRTGSSLAGGTAKKLPIHAAGFVALGGDDVKAADLRDSGAEFNVRSTSGHVCGDGDLIFLTGERDNIGFFLQADRIQEAVR